MELRGFAGIYFFLSCLMITVNGQFHIPQDDSKGSYPLRVKV